MKKRVREMLVLALQPNVDPYNEKFEVSPILQLREMLELADSALSEDVAILLFPETALIETAHAVKKGDEIIFLGPWEGHYEKAESVKEINNITRKFPNLTVIAGVSDKKAFASEDEITATARYSSALDLFYDSYNSLLGLKHNEPISYYRKSKLVPGVESVPFGKLMKKIEGFALDLGGTTGSLGHTKRTNKFHS